MRQNNVRAAMALACAIVAGACTETAPASAPPPDARRVDPAAAATLSGRVVLDGPAPINPPIKMSGDPFCVRENKEGLTLEHFVVADGGLENVFVYVKDGLGNYYFDTPTEPVKVDQQGCQYRPHVFGVRVDQPIDIGTSDATLHNVHALAQVNQEFNFGLEIPGTKQTKRFTKPEVMITLKCDVHGWMRAYAGVLAHPYFAVTAGGGRFEMKNLPAGTYTVEAWHEKLGAQTQTVTIAEKESRAITFTFKAPAPAGT